MKQKRKHVSASCHKFLLGPLGTIIPSDHFQKFMSRGISTVYLDKHFPVIPQKGNWDEKERG